MKRPKECHSFTAEGDGAARELKGSLQGLRTYVAAVRCAMDPSAAEPAAAEPDAKSGPAANDDVQRSSGLG